MFFSSRKLYIIFIYPSDENMCVCALSHSVMSYSVWPDGLQPAKPLFPWVSPGKNIGVGFCALFQGIFPTQGLNLYLSSLPALAGEFFTTSTTWKAVMRVYAIYKSFHLYL